MESQEVWASLPSLATDTAESLQTLPWEALAGMCGSQPNKTTARTRLLLLSQTEVRSPATQDTRLRPWAAPHSPCVPALPQQELAAVRNSVRLALGLRAVSQLPVPVPWLKCIPLMSWLTSESWGAETRIQDCSLPHSPGNCSVNKWVKKI